MKIQLEPMKTGDLKPGDLIYGSPPVPPEMGDDPIIGIGVILITGGTTCPDYYKNYPVHRVTIEE